uniref:Uncharacterized protein n=1 Tax=Arundo donax TaxID=35708 RepID=A0A0A9HNG9_ARUDO
MHPRLSWECGTRIWFSCCDKSWIKKVTDASTLLSSTASLLATCSKSCGS